MKKKHFNILILVSFLAMMICSCKDDYPTNRYPLTKADKQMIPYSLGDTVLFLLKDQSEPVALTVTKDTLVWYDKFVIDEYVVDQWRDVILYSNDQKHYISLYQEVYPADQRVIRIANSEGGYGFSTIRYDRKGFFLEGEVTWEEYNRPISGLWHQEVLDSLGIGDYIYYNVLRKTYSSGTDTLLYNKAYGVLRIVENGEPLLTRVL